MNKILSFPINVGQVNAKNYIKSLGPVSSDSQDGKVISMPAQEQN